jgi:WD40 repeat protein/DNA-binding SARP family transcriptional activator
MEFRILGPLEVRSDAGGVSLGGTKPRAVLAMLLLHADEPVSAERLAQALWGEESPRRAVKTVQVHVSRLRKALGDGEIVATTPAGYRLRLRPGELDAERFARLVEDGRGALADGRAEHAAAVLREALGLWRGPALADLAFEPFAQAEIARLEEQRMAALEARVEADLAVGRHVALIEELRQLVAANPTRERLVGQLMLALYRCGRQAEALEAYRRARRVLIEEVGVEPGPELRALQEAILHQDVSLEPQQAVADLPSELDAAAAPRLVGRSAELGWLRERWKRASGGAGALVTVIGGPGIGKSRLAAELAGDAHRVGAAVLYVTGTGPADAVLAVLSHASEATRPTLLVVDDADQAGADVLAELAECTRLLATVPVLALASGEDADALARLGPDGSLTLEPLDADAVRAIAVRYAPGHSGADVPAEWLLDASGGVPRRVHELAGQWARREAARRVGAVAGRAAAGRAELRSIEAELAGDIVELRAASEQAALLADAEGPVVCPFKGLASFELVDAPFFFGRERLVAELVARLVGAPMLGIIGPSGSGKSSVLRAGLLPALASGVLPGSQDWTQVLIRPGEHPLRELRGAMTDIDGDRRVVLAVDQFEETFTACRDEEERAAFIAELARAARDRHGRTVVVLAVRADHYGRCAAYPELSSLLAANHVLVGLMRRDELRRAIELPAQRVGLRVEPELADALVADVDGESGGLPLLSTALLELWQRRDGRLLRHAAYEHTGGVRGAVARLAEEAFSQLDPAQQTIARSALLRLVGEGAEGAEGEVERRRISLAELETEHSEDVARVVTLLTDRRMVTVSAGTVEIAHEALLREWPRLRAWIEQDREGLRIQRNLTSASQEWRRLDQDEGALYRGTRLTEALEWRARRDPPLSQLERDFLSTSDARRRGERKARRRRVRLAVTALAAGLALVSVVAVVAIVQRERMSEQRDVALSRQLAVNANAALTSNSALSLQLALRAFGVSPTPEAETALRQATWGFRAVAAARRHDRALTVAVAPDGRRLASTGYDGTVILWSWPDYRPVLMAKGPQSRLWALAFSPDGGQLATAGSDGAIRVGSSDDPVATARVIGEASGPVEAIAFSPDGRSIASASEDGSVLRWPVAGGPPEVYDARGGPEMYSVAFSPDEQLLAAGGEDGRIHLWDAAGRSPRGELSRAGALVWQLAFSPDGTRLAAAADDGTTRIWNVQDARAPVKLRGDPEAALTVAFSPDSDRVAVAGESGTVRIWTVRGDLLREMTGQVGRTYSVAWLRDGRHVASAGVDGTTWVWEPAVPEVLHTDGKPVLAVALASDGDIATGSVGGAVRWWDDATQRSSAIARVPPAAIGVDVSPDDRRVAVAAYDGTVLLADQNGRTETLARLDGPVYRATFDSDGRQLVTAEDGGTVRVFSLRPDVSSRVVARHRILAHNAVFSPDSAAVASTGEDRVVRITDLRTGQSRVLEGQGANVNSIAFSPDGQRLIGARSDGRVVLSTRSGRELQTLQGHTGAAVDAALMTSGTLVSAGADGTVRAWSPAARQAVGLGVTSLLLREGAKGINDLDVGADGRIATAGNDGTAMVWRCDVCGPVASVLREARRRATLPLSPAEQRVLRQGAE